MAENIRILIVDDSALMREALRSILESEPSFEVIGFAKDGQEGVQKTLALKPNVITMDMKMPVLTGIDAIQQIMEEQPTAIIVVSTIDERVIAKALGIGAMDFVPISQDIDSIAKDLIEKVRIASHVKPLQRIRKKRPIPKISVPESTGFKLVAIGVSTGGPQALQIVLSKIPNNFPAGIVIVQHITEGFIFGLAEYLQVTCSLKITVASAGSIIKKGTVYFAPDNYILGVNNAREIILKEDTTKKMIYVPSIDEMMLSAAHAFGKDVIGVIMTGMGTDGPKGITAIKEAGGVTIAQDEESSSIFGMNKLAIDSGNVDKVVSLDNIAQELVNNL